MNRQDVSTIIWKERKALFHIRGRRSQFFILMLTPLLLAVVFPIQMGKDWLVSGLNLIVAVIVPLLIVGTSIPDSFAGERERHTLSTLLASRLSDRAIFTGKLLTSVLFGWGMTAVFVIISMIAVNIFDWDGQFAFYSPSILAGNLIISFLMSILTAGAGVLFSLRASTVQEAQQTLMAVLMIPAMILQVGFFVILSSQSGKELIRELTNTISVEQVIVGVSTLLFLLAGFLLWFASRRFQRERLILS
jgi:ABC-2 type transport system permease protein